MASESSSLINRRKKRKQRTPNKPQQNPKSSKKVSESNVSEALLVDPFSFSLDEFQTDNDVQLSSLELESMKGNGDASDVDLNEPTMGERLASLNLLDQNKDESHEEEEPSVPAMPPSADSVHVLLKQALHADDRALLLECLYTKDDKVISKSIAELNSSNVLKLLHSLISIIQSRGAILVCALPWLRGLLLQHASRIMSQKSSLLALNSLYQLIESRISTVQSALLLSSSLDFLYSGVLDEEVDENDAIVPIIFEDEDSEDNESGVEMETDGDEEEEEAF